MVPNWAIARKKATTTLTIYHLCEILGLILHLYFYAALMTHDANKETNFKPFVSLGEYSYYRHLRKNTHTAGRHLQVKKKHCLARETNVQTTGYQEQNNQNQMISQFILKFLDESN